MRACVHVNPCDPPCPSAARAPPICHPKRDIGLIGHKAVSLHPVCTSRRDHTRRTHGCICVMLMHAHRASRTAPPAFTRGRRCACTVSAPWARGDAPTRTPQSGAWVQHAHGKGARRGCPTSSNELAWTHSAIGGDQPASLSAAVAFTPSPCLPFAALRPA